jgi:hypothetical protein
MKKMIRSTVFLALVAGLLVASSVTAYVLLSPARTWDSTPTYIIDQNGASSISDGDGGVSAVVSAINSNQAWNGAGSGNVINAVPGNTGSFQLGDGTPMLRFDDPLNVCTGSCLAATFTGYYNQRGDGTYRIFDADIVTNDGYSWTSLSEPDGCSSEFDIEGVQVHEAGHGLGLGHTNVGGATMYPSVSSCNNGPASIEADDAAGINALYSGAGGGGGGGGGSCSAKGASCSSNGDCCSGKCKGPSGRMSCK